jgi:hypothetical protein
VRRACDRRALPKPRAPVLLNEAQRTACAGVAGITVEVFRSLLSPEDLADIAAGGIHPKTLGACAQSFAEGIRSGGSRHFRRGRGPPSWAGSPSPRPRFRAARRGRSPGGMRKA